jgi:hypothetical protein
MAAPRRFKKTLQKIKKLKLSQGLQWLRRAGVQKNSKENEKI